MENIWVDFSTTSLNKRIAKFFAGRKGTIFIIKLNDNFPHPHAYISTISKHPTEQEVILLPFFRFKEVSREIIEETTYIEIEQDPNFEPFDEQTIEQKRKSQFMFPCLIINNFVNSKTIPKLY